VEVFDGSMEGKHCVIPCSSTVNDEEICTHALTDFRATDMPFKDHDFAHHSQIPSQKLREKRQVEVIDGRPIESGDIT